MPYFCITLKLINMAASKWLNKNALDCECNVSVSRMSAKGHQIRTNNFSSDSQAMIDVHLKMIGAGAGIIGGALLMRSHPILGLICMAVGTFALNDVAKDYRTGKRSSI